jgi:predicted glutamine amidotransferase
MCRFLALAPDRPGAAVPLLHDFRAQSTASQAGGTGFQEHTDGWGVTVSRAGRSAHLARSPASAATDPGFAAMLDAARPVGAGGILLAHFRRATGGVRSLHNTHPFVRDGWAFCHNGSVHGLPDLPGVAYEGTTDSERLFHLVLRQVRRLGDPAEALAAVAEEVDGTYPYSSLTCALTDGNAVHGLRKVGGETAECGGQECAIRLFTLGHGRRDGVRLLAQEPTHLDGLAGWTPLRDGGVLSLPAAPAQR